MNTEIRRRKGTGGTPLAEGTSTAGANSPLILDAGPALRETLDSALVNLHRSMEALRPALASLAQPINPEIVAGLQSTENAWRAIEAEFGMLTGNEVAELLGSKAQGRSSYAADKRKAGKLIGIRRRNALVYPGFQFDRSAGKVREAIPALVAVIREYERTEEDLAQWLCDPSGYLGGDRPVDHLNEPERVLAAAEGHYGVEW
jgi:hypothetical protein